MLLCKVCFGNPTSNICMLCGTKKAVDKEELLERRRYFKEMQQRFNGLRRGQAHHVRVCPIITHKETPEELKKKREIIAMYEFQEEIRKLFGDWLMEPVPVYVSPQKVLYSDALAAQERGDLKKARHLFIKLYNSMKKTDTINFRITKKDIQKRIHDLVVLKPGC